MTDQNFLDSGLETYDRSGSWLKGGVVVVLLPAMAIGIVEGVDVRIR